MIFHNSRIWQKVAIRYKLLHGVAQGNSLLRNTQFSYKRLWSVDSDLSIAIINYHYPCVHAQHLDLPFLPINPKCGLPSFCACSFYLFCLPPSFNPMHFNMRARERATENSPFSESSVSSMHNIIASCGLLDAMIVVRNEVVH